jgi:hypothetical protein
MSPFRTVLVGFALAMLALKAGKVVSTIRRVYSKDGKSFTATVNGMNPKGERTNNTLVYDKT